MKILLGITGASGAVYARMLAEQLLAAGAELGVIFSRNGRAVAEYEGVNFNTILEQARLFDDGDMFAAPASGSARWDAMAVVPCSMGTAARIAAGVSDSLLTRAADVMLKERRPLVIVPREMPLGTLHLRNLLTLSELGAVIIPAAPAFYSLPSSTEDLLRTVTDRIFAHLGFQADGFEWGKK